MPDELDERAVDIPHPSFFIQEELDARGWTLDILAMRMGPEFGFNRLSLDMYFDVGPTEPNLLLGDVTSKQLGRAFNVSSEFFLKLHQRWRESLPPTPAQPKEPRDG